MPGRLFIHAANVHQGGGRTLLNTLLLALTEQDHAIVTVDARMPVAENVERFCQIRRITPSIVQRIGAERWLARHVGPEDIVLCFGNLPPLFALRGRTLVFVQNRYLIEPVNINNFPLRIRIRLAIERLWFSARCMRVDGFVVQTPAMKNLLEQKVHGKMPVQVMPFTSGPYEYSRRLLPAVVNEKKDFDFVYVASGEPHKNHMRLLEAWIILAREGLFPSLCLTLDAHRFERLINEVTTACRQYDLKVSNIGELAHQDILSIHKRSGACIYPSTFESFGLPLIEARQAGLPVLASELDYVRDMLDPEQTFDPLSPTAIARAVKRFIGKEEQTLTLLQAHDFIKRVVEAGGCGR